VEIVWTNRALRKLNNIVDFIAQYDLLTAKKVGIKTY